MGLSHIVSDVLNFPEPAARFVIALYSAYLFSFVYRYYISKQNAAVQNAFFTLSGFSIVFYVYGFEVWHLVVDVVAVYFILWLLGGSIAAVTLTWIVTMGHLTVGSVEVFYSNQIHTISWIIPHCLLVLRLIGLSYNMYDGTKKQEKLSEEMKENVIHKLPPFLELTGFCFFPGAVLVGPQMLYARYQKFVTGKLFDYHSTPSSSPAGLQRMLVGIGYTVLYYLFEGYYSSEYMATQAFADELFFRKLWLIFVTMKLILWRHALVWVTAEGSCIVTGISYNGVDKDGSVDWNGVANVNLIKLDTTITFQGIVESFNITTNKWIAMYVYKRLKWLGSKQVSMVVTMAVLSFWHGLWPGYHIFFTYEFIFLPAERTFIKTMRRVMGQPLSEFPAVVRLPLSLLAYISMNLLMMYSGGPLRLLDWDRCFFFMKAVYFYGHVVMITWLVVYWLLLWLQNGKQRRKED